MSTTNEEILSLPRFTRMSVCLSRFDAVLNVYVRKVKCLSNFVVLRIEFSFKSNQIWLKIIAIVRPSSNVHHYQLYTITKRWIPENTILFIVPNRLYIYNECCCCRCCCCCCCCIVRFIHSQHCECRCVSLPRSVFMCTRNFFIRQCDNVTRSLSHSM